MWRACFSVPKAAQLTPKYVELGIVSAGGRASRTELLPQLMPLHGLRRLGFQCSTQCASQLPPRFRAPGSCAQTPGQQRQTVRAGAEMPESTMLCVAPGWLSLVSPLEPRMTLAGLEPAIFGSEDQRLIH